MNSQLFCQPCTLRTAQLPPLLKVDSLRARSDITSAQQTASVGLSMLWIFTPLSPLLSVLEWNHIVDSCLHLDLLPHDCLSFLLLWNVPRRLLGVVSARESFHRDRRQASSSLTSLTLSSSGAVHGQSYVLVLRNQFQSSHHRVTSALQL